jgi:hypothetical protein
MRTKGYTHKTGDSSKSGGKLSVLMLCAGVSIVVAKGLTDEKFVSDEWEKSNIRTDGTDCVADKIKVRSCEPCGWYNLPSTCDCTNGIVMTITNGYHGSRGIVSNSTTRYSCYYASASGGYWLSNLVDFDVGAEHCSTNVTVTYTTNACIWEE